MADAEYLTANFFGTKIFGVSAGVWLRLGDLEAAVAISWTVDSNVEPSFA